MYKIQVNKGTRRNHQSGTVHSGSAPHVRDGPTRTPRENIVEAPVRPRDSDVIPAALAPETRLQMKRVDTINGSRPTTRPLAQTLRFQTERRKISLATVSSISLVELVSDREILHTGQVLSAPRLATSVDVDAASAMCPALQRSDVVLHVKPVSFRKLPTRTATREVCRRSRGLSPHPLVMPLSPFFSTMLICLMVKRARDPNQAAIRDHVQISGWTLLSPWPTLGSAALYFSLYTLLTQICVHTQVLAGQTVHFSEKLGIVTHLPPSRQTHHMETFYILFSVSQLRAPIRPQVMSLVPSPILNRAMVNLTRHLLSRTHNRLVWVMLLRLPTCSQRCRILFSLNPHLVYL